MRDFLKLVPFYIGLAVWVFSIQDYPFFWDTVQLASKHAHHFYDNGLRWTPLPPEIDSGHPPVFGYYLAWVWSFAGKTLPAGHWAMFPFLCGIVWLVFRLGRRLGGPEWAAWAVPLVFFDPVLAGQSALVSPDIVLLFSFLLAVDGLLGRNNLLVTLGVFGLCAISTRGMMTAAALLLWSAAAWWRPARLFRPPPYFLSAFIPGFAFAGWFLWWHHQATGWTGYHPGSPWAPAFEMASGTGWLRNLLVVGWRWTDFGRIFEWITLFFLAGHFGWKFFLEKPATGSLLKENWLGRGTVPALLGALILLLTPTALAYKMLSAHRYFLPVFTTVHLLTFHLIARSEWVSSRKKQLFALLLAGLLSGNCWIYPSGISMDWDATLAHLPYHRLRADMVRYIESEEIIFSSVGTAFPNINTGENLLLNGDQRQFVEKDFARNEYILASNVFNDFSKEDFHTLEHNWQIIREAHSFGIWLKLYKRPE